MPSLPNGSHRAPKRAAEPSREKRKQPKTQDNRAEERESNTEKDTKLLETEVLESRKNYNNVAILLRRATTQEPSRSLEALQALCRVFCHLLAAGALDSTSLANADETFITKWLSQRLDETWRENGNQLPDLAGDDQKHTLRLLMQLLKEEALSSSVDQASLLKQRSNSILERLPSFSTDLIDFYVSQFAAKYLDIALATLANLQDLLTAKPTAETISSATKIALALTDSQPDALWVSPGKKGTASSGSGSAALQKSYRKLLGESWLATLAQDLDKDQRKTLLRIFPKKIAPTLRKSERLLDFLVDSFEVGGATALLALSGLFQLMQDKNLDYPDFYRKVYSLLDPSILHSKHRSNFLRLLDTFLASSHLPAALVASFLKRLSRLCLFAPPAAIAYIIPMTYNLLKEHPACTFMIHRAPTGEKDDPFNMREPDPMISGALESSLWEIHTLQNHYHPNIAIIARMISEQFTKPAFNLEDFLDHTYATMIEGDLNKSVKKEPVIEYQIPKTVFPRQMREEKAIGDALELWGFDS